ncbi:hypothetical protein LDA53_11300 [Enterococcus faecium]|nr:hypothetical protein [Enterococcus faecium]
MVQRLSKAEFKEKYKYSESTYQRRMKEFKKSRFSEGYNAVTSKEITIDVDLYEQFRTWRSKNRLELELFVNS